MILVDHFRFSYNLYQERHPPLVDTSIGALLGHLFYHLHMYHKFLIKSPHYLVTYQAASPEALLINALGVVETRLMPSASPECQILILGVGPSIPEPRYIGRLVHLLRRIQIGQYQERYETL